MCSPNVHFEHFLGGPLSSTQPSSSRQHIDSVRSLAQARLSGSSSIAPGSFYAPSNPSAIASGSAQLSHTINHHSSVLSLAVDERRSLLYSGSQEGFINVWDLETFQSTVRLAGHSASVLALELAPEKNWLFSSSGDNTVRVWDTVSNAPLFVVYPAEDNVGDIFALKWCAGLETLYLGCQSTSIQWICLAGFGKGSVRNGAVTQGEGVKGTRQFGDLSGLSGLSGVDRRDAGADSPIISTPDLMPRPHKFFDSVPVALSRSGMGSAGTSTPTLGRPSATSALSSTKVSSHKDKLAPLAAESSLASIGPLSSAGATETVLNAASVRLDSPAFPSISSEPQLNAVEDGVRTLLIPPSSSVPSAHYGYIYSLALLTLEGDTQHPTVLASGSGDETIKLWHATRSGLSLLATLESPNADGNAVLALASWKTTLFSGLQGGEVEVWDLETCTLVRTIRAHTDDVICVETCAESGLLFTAGADGKVNTWDRSFRNVGRVQAHDGIVLSLAKISGAVADGDRSPDGLNGRSSTGPQARVVQLVTGSSDNRIRIWDTLPSIIPSTSGREAESRRRELERLSLEDPASAPLATTPIAATSNVNSAAEVVNTVGPEAASILAPNSNNAYEASAQWPLLRSLLRKFISFPSISASEEHREDCRQAAHFLKTCFQELGAEARILPNPVGTNPLVLGTFKANANRSRRRHRNAAATDRSRSSSTSASTDSTDSFLSSNLDDTERDGEDEGLSGSVMFNRLGDDNDVEGEERELRGSKKKRCLFYGHYDCIAAEGSWTSPPFTLDGRDGYLYGRGVSDNKGPILASACAVHHLLSTRRLHSDVVFLIEGEEENGSVGFVEAVRRYKSEIGPIDVVLLSNSYWLDEETPCLTVGLRGVVRATVSVGSGERDVHSGVEGGAIREPMVDMVKLLAQLTGEGERVALPGFYDSVRGTTESELQAYRDIVRIKRLLNAGASKEGETVESLMAKWRNPSLSVHNIRVSGPGNSTVIPSTVSAQVSLRIVPDQDLPSIEASLLEHVQSTFNSLYPTTSPSMVKNKVSVTVDHRADWWMGSDSSQYFLLLREAVKEEWNAEPISIREGGSIPGIAILEKELGAGAVHLPMGQSSDNAHLPNERLRQTNLVKGQNVVRRFVLGLPAV